MDQWSEKCGCQARYINLFLNICLKSVWVIPVLFFFLHLSIVCAFWLNWSRRWKEQDDVTPRLMTRHQTSAFQSTQIKEKDGRCRWKSYAGKRWCCLIKRGKKVGNLREQIKSCNECAVILAVLISLFVYFSSHLPRHAVPQCFPSSLVRSYCCALMHVLGWCSCPGRLCLFACVASVSVRESLHAGTFFPSD